MRNLIDYHSIGLYLHSGLEVFIRDISFTFSRATGRACYDKGAVERECDLCGDQSLQAQD